MDARSELEMLRQQQGPIAAPTVDPRVELEMLRQQQGPLATPSPAPTGGIAFANGAEGQGYGPKGDRSLPAQIGHVAGASVVRPLAPLTAATAGGAALGMLGGPFAELSVPAGAGLGAASYAAAHLADLPVGAANAVLPQNWQMPYPGAGFDNLVQSGLNKLGIGVPENAPERVAASTVGSIGDALTGNELGGVLKLAANPTLRLAGEEMAVKGQPTETTTLGGVGKGMSAKTTKQLAQVGTLGGISGAAAGEAREAFPDSPLAQMLAGVLAPAAVIGVPNLAIRGINAVGPNRLGAFITGNNAEGNFVGRRQAASEAAAQDRLANEWQTAAGTPEQRDIAVKNLTDAIDNLTDRNPNAGPLNPNFLPVSGTASGNTGLIRIEKGFANQELADRNAQNQLAISQGLAKATTPTDVPVSVAQNAVNKNLSQRVGAVQNNVNVAEQQANQASQTLAERQAELLAQAPDSVRAKASSNVRDTLNENFNKYRQQAESLYAKIPDDPSLTVDVSGPRAIAQKLVKAAEGTSGEFPKDHPIRKFLDVTESGTMSPQKAQRELEVQWSKINEYPVNSVEARDLGEVRAALDNAISKVEPLSGPLKDARNFYRDELVPRYKQGASARVLNQRSAGGAEAVPPEKTIDAYMGTPTEADRLKSALSAGGELPPTTAEHIRNWAVSDMASSLGNNPTAEGIRKWLRNNDSVMSLYPDVKKEINATANRMGSAYQAKDTLLKDLGDRRAELSKTQSEVASSPQAKFVGDITNPANEEAAVAHVNSFLYGDQAASGMATLLKEVQGNPQAVESLKNAVQKSLQDRITNLGRNLNPTNAANAVTTADLPASTAKLNDLLREGSPTRNALSKIYSPEEMQSLDRYRKQLELTDRINQKSTKGSDTQALTTAQEGQNAVKRLSWGMTLTNFLKKVGSVTDLANTAGRAILMKNPEQVYQQMKVKALLDPELARSLLLEPTDKNLPIIKTAFNKFLTAYVGADSQQNTNAKKPSRAKRMIGDE